MVDDKNKKKGKDEEKRGSAPFAWLGPMLERRKPKIEPIEDPDEGQELEEVEE